MVNGRGMKQNRFHGSKQRTRGYGFTEVDPRFARENRLARKELLTRVRRPANALLSEVLTSLEEKL